MFTKPHGLLLSAALILCLSFAQARVVDNPNNLPVPNPYLSYLPASATPDIKQWQKKIVPQQFINNISLKKQGSVLGFVDNEVIEIEPNDSFLTAQELVNFGTASGQSNTLSINATFQQSGDGNTDAIIELVATQEDNGDLLKATEIDFQVNTTYLINSEIGDGEYGRLGLGTGDFDFYKLKNVAAGQVLSLDINAQSLSPSSALDSNLFLLNSEGDILLVNDYFDGFDSFISYTTVAEGDYYVVVGAWASPFLGDIEDSSSGGGASSEGPYQLVISSQEGLESDYFSINALEGDVLGVAVNGAATRVEVYDFGGVLSAGSEVSLSYVLPSESDFSNLQGNASIIFVIPESGTYFIKASGLSSNSGLKTYSIDALIRRPALEQGLVPQKQRLFIDFDGASINSLELFDYGYINAQLSPIDIFIELWGLEQSDKNELIDGILAVMEEQLKTELKKSVANSNVDLELLNSRDHADVFGQNNVSRIIIGGTTDEIGLFTIGIAESIDPGNYATQETAVVLLDALSAPASDGLDSINYYELEGGSLKIDLIARAVGTIASHEAGHFLSSFHTENSNEHVNIMDQGGNFPQLLGLNQNGKYEEGFAPLVQFIADAYSFYEGFVGVEDTMKSTAYGLTSVSSPSEPGSESESPKTSNISSSGGGGSVSSWMLIMLYAFLFVRGAKSRTGLEKTVKKHNYC